MHGSVFQIWLSYYLGGIIRQLFAALTMFDVKSFVRTCMKVSPGASGIPFVFVVTPLALDRQRQVFIPIISQTSVRVTHCTLYCRMIISRPQWDTLHGTWTHGVIFSSNIGQYLSPAQEARPGLGQWMVRMYVRMLDFISTPMDVLRSSSGP